MQSIVLHSYRRCPFAIRVRMTLEEKNIPYTVIEENLASLSSELLNLHPEGRVPLLIHNQQVIYESSIITEYLEDAFPNPPLMPKDPAHRALVRLWTYWCNEIFKENLDSYKYSWIKLESEQKLALKDRLLENLKKVDFELNNKPYLLGKDLTLADIHLFPLFRQLQRCQPPLAELENFSGLMEWLVRMSNLPSFERAMQKK